MNFNKINKAIYNDPELLMCMEILKEENWKKAKVSKRIEFFKKFHEVVSASDSSVPAKFLVVDFKDADIKQNIVVGEKGVAIDKRLFSRTISPYRIIASYMFEIGVVDNVVKGDSKSAEHSKNNRKYFVNNAQSIFNNWDNYFERESEEFMYQPISDDSYRASIAFVYKLLVHMHKTFGMDSYIGSELMDIMLEEFKKEESTKRVAKNYKIMEEQQKLYSEEIEKQDKLFEFLDDHPSFDDLEDEEFFFLLNTALIEGFSMEFRLFIYKEFARRAFKDEKLAEEFNENFTLAVTEDGQNVVIFGEEAFLADVHSEFGLVISNLFYSKVKNGCMFEIEDEDFKVEAMECLAYMEENQDDKGYVVCKYLTNALAYIECKNILLDYYYNLVNKSIKENKIINYGEPLFRRGDFSKYESYLEFTFNKKYEEVRKEQFASLKEKYNKMKGAK